MATATDAPVDLYIAAYNDAEAADEDWEALKALASEDVIKVDGLILISREADGTIHVKDNLHKARKGAAWGAVGGAVLGLIFPPSIIATAAVGAGLGAGAGALISHGEKSVIKAEVDRTLPPNTSGIVALFEDQWAAAVDNSLTRADNVTKQEVDADSAKGVKAAVTSNPPATA